MFFEIAVPAALCGCASRLPPGGDLAALMPESTRAVLVVRCPVTTADGRRENYDEPALAAHNGFVDLLKSSGAFVASVPLMMNSDENWNAVGVSAPLWLTKGQMPDAKSSGMVFATLSKLPLDGPDGEWTSMQAKPTTRHVSEVHGVSIYHIVDEPDFLDENAKPDGAYVALIDRRLYIAAFEQSRAEEAVRRAFASNKSLPRALRAAGELVPTNADGYLLSSHQASGGGMLLSIFNTPANVDATQLAVYRQPGVDMGYRFVAVSSHRERDYDEISAIMKPNQKTGEGLSDLAKFNLVSTEHGSVLELRFDVERIRAAMAGEGVIMGMYFTYSEILADTGPIQFDEADEPSDSE